jgi:hypothetical protein
MIQFTSNLVIYIVVFNLSFVLCNLNYKVLTKKRKEKKHNIQFVVRNVDTIG